MHTNTRDDHAFNINFVQLVKNEKCLYDKSLPEYRNKDEHDKAWEKIANNVNENVPHCKERWRNLRACLTRHLKNSKQQSANGNTHYKPYYLAEHMKFVLPYTKCRSQRDNPVVAEETTSSHIHVQKIEIDDYDDEKTSESDTPAALGVQAVVGSIPKKEIVSSTRFVFVPPLSSTPNNAVKRTAPVFEQEATDAGNPSTSAEKKPKTLSDPCVIKEFDDADLSFFKSLLPDIRQMTPTQKRKFKMGIFELINNIVD